MTRIPIALAGEETEPLAGAAADEWDGDRHNVLGFNLTMRCPLRCDFCCYSCHPDEAEIRTQVQAFVDELDRNGLLA